MRSLVRTETRKLLTSPRWWLVGAGMVLVSVAIAALVTVVGLTIDRSPLELGAARDVGAIINVASGFAFVFAIVLGVLIVTGDRTDRTLALTLLAGRSRGRVYAAKTIAAAVFGVLLAVATLLATTIAVTGLLIAFGQPVSLTDPEILRRLTGGIAVLTLWAIAGVGIGALVQHQLAAILGVVALTQAVEPVLRMSVPAVGDVLPGSIAEVASGGTLAGLALGAPELGQYAALGLMTAGVAAVLALGAWRYRGIQV